MTHVPLRNDADPQWRAMHLAAEQQRAELTRVLLIAFAAMATRGIRQRIRAALRVGDIEAAMQAVPVANALMLRAAIEQAMAQTALAGARIARATAVVRLGSGSGLLNADVLFWARTRSAALVAGITEQARQALRQAIVQALESGTAPRELAGAIAETVGLNTVQARALLTRYDELVERGVDAVRRQAILERYAAQLRRQRAQVIARHELMQAANEGRRLQWEREVRDGLIIPDRWEREWVAIVPSDGRTCKFCIDADGTRAPINGVYPTGIDGPPGHVLCRCTERRVRRAA